MIVVTAAQMRALEERSGVLVPELMERAGRAIAHSAATMLGGARYQRIVVLAGPGNNGGDGLVAARHLREEGAWVRVGLLAPRAGDDLNVARLRDRDVPFLSLDDPALLDDADLVIDALLGTGRSRSLEGPLAALLDRLGEVRARSDAPALLAVDLPTGVDADTGSADPHAVAADRTVTLGCGKPGLHVWPGSALAGVVEVADIGLPRDEIPPFGIIEGGWVGGVLPPRSPDANKGTFGRVLIAAGSRRYTGAATLSALAALRSGAGLSTLACPASVQAMLAGGLREVTFLPLPESGEGVLDRAAARQVLKHIKGYRALLVGPGLTDTADARAFLETLLRGLPRHEGGWPTALVLDADALNILARGRNWSRGLRLPAVLTPHPGEMARLLGRDIAGVQADRLACAVQAAHRWGQVVVLKGANTIVAAPDGRARICSIATPALATAGTGDVLAGAIAGLIGQGMAPFDAATAAVWVHARAGQRLSERMGDRGVIAGDVMAELPYAFRDTTA